jgi:tRNA(Ile2) C34 agmatinyltransferase TiaS
MDETTGTVFGDPVLEYCAVPPRPRAAQVEAKPLHQTLTLAAASRFTTKVVSDHLQSGLGRGQIS